MPAGTTGIGAVDWETCALEARPDPELHRFVRREVGMVPDHFDYYTACPWMARQWAYFAPTTMPLHAIDPDLVELLGLVVAQDNSCRYCYAATRVVMRALGFADATVQALEQGMATSDVTPAERAALDFARRFSRASPLAGPEALAPLRTHGFDDAALLEIVYVTGLNVVANRFVTLPAVPIGRIERMSEWRWLRFLQPLATLAFRRARRKRHPTALTDTEPPRPFAQVVRTFEGHPIGPRLATHIDDAWGSPILPRRTKALIAAVIGRALGCTRSEAEARRLLREEGADLDLDDVLAHLASPALTDAEAMIVPFVRETVHYDPAPIQRHGQALMARLGQPVFLETIGMAALANGLCRMAAVLADPAA
jgi:alkylhydroperoxidase family enzyme